MTRPHLLRPAYLRIVEKYPEGHAEGGATAAGWITSELMTNRPLGDGAGGIPGAPACRRGSDDEREPHFQSIASGGGVTWFSPSPPGRGGRGERPKRRPLPPPSPGGGGRSVFSAPRSSGFCWARLRRLVCGGLPFASQSRRMTSSVFRENGSSARPTGRT